jgi:hypothetical protein
MLCMKHWREYEYPREPFERYGVMLRRGHLKKVPFDETPEVLGLYWVLEKLRALGWDVLRGERINRKRRS